MKTLNKNDKVQIWSEVNSEGLGYWIQNYGDQFIGIEYESLVKQTREGLDKLDELISSFEHYSLDQDCEM